MVASDRVVLLDDDAHVVGSAPKASIHTQATALHLAFSCYLFDAHGRVLLTRRSLSKRTWPGVWTNSFCGHPAPDEAMVDAVHRHGLAELGVRVTEPRLELPDFRYRAVDASGVVENEVCPVFIAHTQDPIEPNPAEVAEWVWVAPADVIRTAAAMPQLLSPWSVLQIPLLADALLAGGRP